jgi:N-acetylglucosaminyldiphosphoundecaprenol N-acetyl-beta-D-mannosaminyltransferase
MAPAWMQRRGLEWLFRLTREPGRLWKRYLVTNTIFLALFARELFRRHPRPPRNAGAVVPLTDEVDALLDA